MKKIHVLCILFIAAAVLSACSKSGKDESSLPRRSQNTTGWVVKESGEMTFLPEEYKKYLLEYRSPIQECKDSYEADFKKITSQKNENYDFSKCVLKELPDFESVKVMVPSDDDVGVDETINAITELIESEGLQDKANVETELMDASGQLRYMYPDTHPVVFENRSLFTSGRGFYLHNQDISIQMGEHGFYSFSDGTMSRLKNNAEGNAFSDCIGEYSKEITKKGSVGEIGDTTVNFLDGKLTVSEAAANAEKFFLDGTPFKPADNIGVEIYKAKIFQFDDNTEGCAFMVRRIYDGIPFAYDNHGSHTEIDDYAVQGDIKEAYTIEGKSVNAYVGYNENQKFDEVIVESDKILSLYNAFGEVQAKLGSELRVDFNYVGLEYVNINHCPAEGEENFCFVVHPCWTFAGKQGGSFFGIYVDVLTGDVYYAKRVDL